MSSIKNAIHRPSHRERAQPLSRSKHGLLEKHKDYSLRAKDHNAKKARLRLLQQKATDRNPDEFHFGMMSSRTKDGIKITDRSSTSKGMSQEVAKLLKTQDAGYLRNMANKARRERERLEQEIQIIQDGKDGDTVVTSLSNASKSKAKGSRSHTVFVDDEQERKGLTAEDWFHTTEEGLHRSYNRPRIHTNNNEQVKETHRTPPKPMSKAQQAEEDKRRWKEERNLEKRSDAAHERKRQLLKAVKAREAELNKAIEELDVQRARMNGNIGDINKNGVKFKVRERKR